MWTSNTSSGNSQAGLVRYYYYATVEELQQDVVNNRTQVRIRGYARGAYEPQYEGHTATGQLYIDNSAVGWSTAPSTLGTSDAQIAQADIWIDHDSDGSKNISIGISLSCSGSGSYLPDGVRRTLSPVCPLTTIPRASEIVSIGSFNIEEPFALEIDKKAESFTDKLTVKLGDEVIKVVNDYESESDIQFTDEEQLRLYNLIADWDATLTFLLETYNGETLVGSDTATETVYIGGDVTYHTGGTDRKATFYIGTANGIKRCITYDGVKRTYR